MHTLLLGLSLGLSAGFSPGPLMTLVVTTSLQDGFWHGLRVAAAPFVSDLPIILLSVFVLHLLPPWTLAIVGVAGGSYVVYLGWETIRSAKHANLAAIARSADPAAVPDQGWRDLRRGAVVNALNPHPYIFWATVGGPTLIAAFNQSLLQGVLFLVSFYVMLVGSKVVVAALVHSQAHRLSDTWYQRILTLLGVLLMGLGVWLGWQALQFAGF
jgi:threonine/homoserine/homoserine lactone efflux protein